MEHVAGPRSSASTRMSPGAPALAVLLHVAAAVALWWITVNRPALPPVEEPIEITIEKPKPPDPPPPPKPEPQAQPKPPPEPKPQTERKLPPPPPPVLDGLRPHAETAEKRSQVRPSGEAPKDIAGPPPKSLEDQAPEPPSPPPPTETAMRQQPVPQAPTPPTQAEPAPKPAPGPTVTPAPSAPSPTAPAPAPAVAQPPPQPTPTPPVAAQPQPRPAPPPPSITPHPQPRPTPLISRPQDQPPAIGHRQEPPSSSPLVNPADRYNRNLARDNYLIQFNRKLMTYYFDSRGVIAQAIVRVVIARDGRLLQADMVQSSGYPDIDRGVIAGLRASSPYPPLPPEMGVDRATFTLPIGTIRGRL